MSNIFEALKRAERENPELSPSLVMEEQTRAVDLQADSQAPVAFVAPTATQSQESPKPEPDVPVASSQAQTRTLAIRIVAGAPILPFDGAHPRAGEQYRILRTKIIQHPRQPRLCVVTSPGPGDGKTVTAINLAGALALRTDAKVVLVDGDLRRSSVASLLGLPETPGLADVLAGARKMEEVLIRVEQLQNLYVIPAGKACANPTELLDSNRWPAACAAFRKEFRFTILDVPPIASVADYDLIQAPTDGVVMVVRQDHTNRNHFLRALEAVPKEKVIGIALNCVTEWFLWKSHNYYYYSGPERGMGFQG